MKRNVIITKFIGIFICSIAFMNISSAQVPLENSEIMKRSVAMLSIIKAGNSADMRSWDAIVDPKLVADLDVISSKELIKKKYGNIGADFVFVMTVKPGVKFLNLSQIFELHNVDVKYRGYPVLIDTRETTDSKTLIANTGSIEKVLVNKEKKYIDIITIFYKNFMELKKSGEESKRELLKKASEEVH